MIDDIHDVYKWYGISINEQNKLLLWLQKRLRPTIKRLQCGWCEILGADSPGALHAARMCQQLVYLQAASISSECFSMNRSVPSANEGAKLLVGNITLEDSVGNIMNY